MGPSILLESNETGGWLPCFGIALLVLIAVVGLCTLVPARQADVYVLTSDRVDSLEGSINGVSIKAVNPRELDASVAAMKPMTLDVLSQAPGEGASVTVNTNASRAIHRLFFGHNIFPNVLQLIEGKHVLRVDFDTNSGNNSVGDLNLLTLGVQGGMVNRGAPSPPTGLRVVQ